MAYNYLSLVNDVNRRVNELPLTSSNFDTAKGFHRTSKEAVNSAIRYINQDEFEWPFNHTTQLDTLSAGVMRYPLPSDAKRIKWDSFRIIRNDTFGNETQLLKQVDYEMFMRNFIDDEYNTTNTGIRNLPKFVAQSPSDEYIVMKSPDQDYDLEYEYFMLPVDLELYTDVPSLPPQFRHIIVDGAMYYVYLFRNDKDAANMQMQKFEEQINDMRKNYINRWVSLKDTRIERNNFTDRGFISINGN